MVVVTGIDKHLLAKLLPASEELDPLSLIWQGDQVRRMNRETQSRQGSGRFDVRLITAMELMGAIAADAIASGKNSWYGGEAALERVSQHEAIPKRLQLIDDG